MKQNLVLFAKPPLPGVAKTRLAENLGTDEAAQVARGMLLDTVDLCQRVAAGSIELVLAYTHARAWFERHVGGHWRLLEQVGRGLGERLDNALAALDAGPEDATVFIGMDSPHLAAEVLLEGFRMLREEPTVLGPCEDGGYYLIGTKGAWPGGTLAAVRWSTHHAKADTLQAFNDAGLHYSLLPVSYDVDDLASLQRLACDLGRADEALLPATRRALMRLGII